MPDILNLTPHTVNLMDDADETLLTFVPSGTVARSAQLDEPLPALAVEGIEIKLVRTVFGAPIDLPPAEDGVYLIVSAVLASAAKASGRATSDLLIPAGPVRDSEGRIVGCRYFAQV